MSSRIRRVLVMIVAVLLAPLLSGFTAAAVEQGTITVSGVWPVGQEPFEAVEVCLTITLNEAGEAVSGIPLRWGSVVSATLSFLITAAVVYFLMILPLNSYKARLAARKGDAPQTPTEPTEIELLTEIRDALVASRGAVELGPQAQAVLGAPRDGAEDGGSQAGLAGQPAGLAGGHLLPGAGLGDPGGGHVGEQGVVVDQHHQGGGLAAVAGQVGPEDPFEQGEEPADLVADVGERA